MLDRHRDGTQFSRRIIKAELQLIEKHQKTFAKEVARDCASLGNLGDEMVGSFEPTSGIAFESKPSYT